MSREFTYRVVGIRTEGTHVRLGEGLTLPRAEAIRDALSGGAAFRDIVIEVEREPSD